MTFRKLAQALGLCAVAVLGIYSMIATGPNNQTAPTAPALLSLEIPSNAFGAGFSGVQPAIAASTTTPPTLATYFVLPLLTTVAPIVRMNLSSPYPVGWSVTATDVTRSVTATIPQNQHGNPAPSTEYFEVLSVTPINTATSLIYIRYPSSFQGSKLIRTMISDTVNGVASAPLTSVMSFRGSTVVVSIVTQNNDGRVTSNPPGIDCPGTCTADFLTSTNVILSQSVLHNATEFTGWMGSCSGPGSCTVSLLAPGAAVIPINATVTANFRIHSNTPIPTTVSCPAPPLLAGKTWVGVPNCGMPPPLGATLQCDASGNYFCCGVSGGAPTAHCPGGNETGVSCGGDSLGVFGSNAQLIQPGGCYINNP